MKVERLRKQKHVQFDKMMKVVSCGLDSIEELEKVEKEEVEKVLYSFGVSDSPTILNMQFEVDWNDVYSEVILSSRVIADLGFAGGTDQSSQNSSVDT